MIRFEVGQSTDTGRARTQNEDAVFVGDRLFAVADGMGGHAGGEIAAHLVVDRCEDGPEAWTTEGVVTLVEEANAAIVARAEEDPDLRGMGTTVTLLARLEPSDDYPDERLVIANVGDSRTYVFDGDALQQLTDDHTLVQRLVRSGALTPQEAAEHPQRNVVTRALGIGEDVLVDTWEVRVFTGDRFLLCSDGLSGELGDQQIEAVLRRLANPQEAADELVRLANEAGGHDNISVVLVDVAAADVRPADDTGERVVVELSAATREEEEQLDGLIIDDDAEIDHAAIDDLRAAALAADAAHHGDVDAAVVEDELSGRPRRFTWRVAAFVLALLAVAALVVGAIGWSARNTFYVTVDEGQVVILRGEKDGVLWFDPTLEERTSIAQADLPEEYRREVVEGKRFPSLGRARVYVQRVEERIADLATPAADLEDLEDLSGSGAPEP